MKVAGACDTSRPMRAWTRLPSGRHLDLLQPASDVWLDTDLAKRLSRTYRWCGESLVDTPLSVAQHSLLVLALRRLQSSQPLTPVEALMELLHDAEEGFLGFDPISPVKAILGVPFEALTSRLTRAIRERYRIGPWSNATEYSLHKFADASAAAAEAVHCIGWSRAEVRNVLGINAVVIDADPLASIYGCAPWEPWSVAVASERFLAELTLLQSQAAEFCAAGTDTKTW